MTKQKVKKHEQTNKELCAGCSDCCRYIAMEIDKPTSSYDFQNIVWYLHHKNVGVYIGWDNKWYLEFLTPCEQLNLSGLCKIYDKRPDMCRKYKQSSCTKYNNEMPEKKYFKSAEEFDKYCKEKMKIKK